MPNINITEIKKRLRIFSKEHASDTDEKQHAQQFWRDFYACFGLAKSSASMFEARVVKIGGNKGYIDSFIPSLLLVEHKSLGKDLDDGYRQAQEYFHAITNEFEKPQFIIVCDFQTFHLYNLAVSAKEPHICKLENLADKADWFMFLADKSVDAITEETPINRKAAYQISLLHKKLLDNNFVGRDLEIFLTRLLFCLFADDTGIFGADGQFRRLIEHTRQDGADTGSAFALLYQVLNTAHVKRQINLDDSLKAFEYVNGELFAETTQIPFFDSELRDILLDCVKLDWSAISPAIFGAMFQAVLEDGAIENLNRKQSRRELGAHYTSERNILKVIEPLFLDELRKEFERAKNNKTRLQALYDKLPTLNFLDPACGCGNFLVIAYRELRRFENDVIEQLFFKSNAGGLFDIATLCRVNVGQFYGIEIDEAAAHIARVALYITDHQQNTEAARRFGTTRATVPLVTTPHIHHANALRVDWSSVLSAERCSYVLGNPPFIGHHLQKAEQKQEMLAAYGVDAKSAGVMDYVSAWYLLAAKYIKSTKINVAFVSTNSITQGEQVGIMWRALQRIGKFNIQFAHRTFKWSNDAKAKAAVYCVIICFTHADVVNPVIYSYDEIDGEAIPNRASQINAYLVDAAWLLLENRSKNPFNAPEMMYGSKPTDGGNYLFTDEEKEIFLRDEPNAIKFIKPFIGAHEYLYNEKRWVLWLVDAKPDEINSLPKVRERVQAVDTFRKASKAETTRNYPYPTLFRQVTQPKSSYVLIPGHTSENRSYIPFGFFDAQTIVGNSCFSLPNATLFHFGVIQSRMHMAWVRYTCGRLESRFRYSKDIVYNNFVWPLDVSENNNDAIVICAQSVIAARANSVGTLADLYDALSMPADLVDAHRALDRAVDKAYGYKGADDDASRVAFLFKLYEQMTSLFTSAPAKKARKSKTNTTA